MNLFFLILSAVLVFAILVGVSTFLDIPDEQKAKEIFDIAQQPKSGY